MRDATDYMQMCHMYELCCKTITTICILCYAADILTMSNVYIYLSLYNTVVDNNLCSTRAISLLLSLFYFIKLYSMRLGKSWFDTLYQQLCIMHF